MTDKPITEQSSYGRIVSVSPPDERGRVTVTHEDGTMVTTTMDQLPCGAKIIP